MKFNRKKFFSSFRREFGAIKSYQVEGLEGLLWGFETYWGWWKRIDHIANALAQVKIETAHSFLPVVEGYYLARGVPIDAKYFRGEYDRVRRFRKNLRYYPYEGRGHIQLTWKTNYQKQTRDIKKYFPEILAEVEKETSQKFNLVKNSDLALHPKISFCVFTIGMHKGTFRKNLKLSDFNRKSGFDHFNARGIVNGDKYYTKGGEHVGNKVKRYALQFERILRASRIKDEDLQKIGSTPEPPAPTEDKTPTPTDTSADIPSVDSDKGLDLNDNTIPPDSGDGPSNGKVSGDDAYIPQIDTAKNWLKWLGGGGILANVGAYMGNMPETLKIVLGILLIVLVVGGIVIFIIYHQDVFAYVKKMHEHGKKIKGAPPKE